MWPPEPKQDKRKRLGCTIFASLMLLLVLLLIGVSLGWFGETERKITDMLVVGGQ